MDLSLFQLANFILVALLIFLIVRFFWVTIFHPFNQPAAWEEAKREKRLPPFLVRMGRLYPDKIRFYTWWLQTERLHRDKVPGAFAELGVYKGDSARLLHQMDSTRKLYLFDTFEGFPETDLEGETGKAASYTTLNFADTSVSKVLRRINGNDLVKILPGYFPDSAAPASEERFALVNIDVDLYKPTKAGLEFFYPRINRGGVLLVHDYNRKWPGVIKAVDEFLSTIPEIPFLIPDRDGTVVILKGTGHRAQGN